MEGGYGAVVSGAPEKGSGAPPFAAANGSNGAKRDGESWSLLANDISLAEAGQNGRGNWASNGTKHVGVFGKGARRTDNNRLVTILLVLNYMIGSGILNTSQTALRSGLAATTVLYVIACKCCTSHTVLRIMLNPSLFGIIRVSAVVATSIVYTVVKSNVPLLLLEKPVLE